MENESSSVKRLKVTSIMRVRDAERKMLVGHAFKDPDGKIRLYLDLTPPSGQVTIHPEDQEPVREHAIFSPLFMIYTQLRSHSYSGLTASQSRFVDQQCEKMLEIPGFREYVDGF